MHTKGPKEDPLVDLGYDARDVNPKAVERALVYFFTFATVMFVTGAFIYANINPAFKPSVIAEKENLRIPKSPNPLLQDNVTNFTDIMHLRQHETSVLTSTGWTDSTHTAVHIPIETAIDLLAQRGLPKTSSDTPAVSKGNTTDERKAPAVGEPTVPSANPTSGTSSMMTPTGTPLSTKPPVAAAPKTTPLKKTP